MILVGVRRCQDLGGRQLLNDPPNDGGDKNKTGPGAYQEEEHK